MDVTDTDASYRSFIDLVDKCRTDFYEERALSGVWNRNARPDFVPEDHEKNLLLQSLTLEQRRVLGAMLMELYVSGVFDTLVALHEEQIEPFDRGYESSPFNDFMGRLLGDWDWPTDRERA
ncbi:MAG: DUF6547 family protein [Actinomycetota bacterium]